MTNTQLKSKTFEKKLTLITLILISLIPFYMAIQHHSFLNDDTYITLTYVKNLIQGNGFVFNHPPATLGTTTPLLTLSIALLGSLLPWFDPANIAVFFITICWIGIIWSFYVFRREWELKYWQVTILGLVIALTGWIEYLGMEAYLFALLLVISFSLFWRHSYFICGIAIGLLFLTRGEGLLLLCLLPCWYLILALKTKNLFTRSTVRNISVMFFGFFIPVIPWSLYALNTFGYILPHTLEAKQAQVQSQIWRPFLQMFIQDWIFQWKIAYATPFLPISLWLIFIILGITAVITHRRRWLLFGAWILLYCVGYIILNVSAYDWYQLPILFVLHLFFALGIMDAANAAGRITQTRYQTLLSLFIGVGLVLFALTPAALHHHKSYKGDFRGSSYTNLSQWFQENTLPSNSVAYVEIGYLGYFTHNQIMDLIGLASPEVLPHVAQGDLNWAFWQTKPDYYIYLPDFDWLVGDIVTNPDFNTFYEPVTTLPGPVESDFTIYKRKDE